MAGRNIVKKYENEEITVIWKPDKCIHSGICVRTLPKVYNPDVRPWIKPENASGKELQEQIETCPSGALSYVLKKAGQETKTEQSPGTSVEVVANGPLLVKGTLEVHHPDGQREMKKRSTAFCRCGGSGNKPYCDGTHNKINFKG